MKNNTFAELGEVLREEKNFIIFTHISGDADTLGTGTALCKALRNLNKKAYIAVEDEVARNLKFLDWDREDDFPMMIFFDEFEQSSENFHWRDSYLDDEKKNGYVSICVDCGDFTRFPKRESLFKNGKITMCIDHHKTTEPFCDYNYIDPEAAATAEIIYGVLVENGIAITEEIAKSIFAGITTDTGNFQYSNTRKLTHEIVAKLYDIRDHYNDVSVEIYETSPVSRLLLQSDIIGRLELFSSGKGCISYVTQEMLKFRDAQIDDSEGVVSALRSIDGVEVAAFLKERQEGDIKVSLRAKNDVDVAKISQRSGGGGHRKAAGFSLDMPMNEAVEFVRKQLESVLDCRKANM